MRTVNQVLIFAMRVSRAWRFYTRLHYSWRMSWAKAGYYDGGLA